MDLFRGINESHMDQIRLTSIGLAATIVLTLGGCDRPQKSPLRSNFQIAMDDTLEDVALRKEAISRLNEADRQKVRQQLSEQLPGEWDLKTYDAIDLLGIVGTSETVVKLRQLLDSPGGVPDKIRTCAIAVINEIQSEEQNQKKSRSQP